MWHATTLCFRYIYFQIIVRASQWFENVSINDKIESFRERFNENIFSISPISFIYWLWSCLLFNCFVQIQMWLRNGYADRQNSINQCAPSHCELLKNCLIIMSTERDNDELLDRPYVLWHSYGLDLLFYILTDHNPYITFKIILCKTWC